MLKTIDQVNSKQLTRVSVCVFPMQVTQKTFFCVFCFFVLNNIKKDKGNKVCFCFSKKVFNYKNYFFVLFLLCR